MCTHRFVCTRVCLHLYTRIKRCVPCPTCIHTYAYMSTCLQTCVCSCPTCVAMHLCTCSYLLAHACQAGTCVFPHVCMHVLTSALPPARGSVWSYRGPIPPSATGGEACPLTSSMWRPTCTTSRDCCASEGGSTCQPPR